MDVKALLVASGVLLPQITWVGRLVGETAVDIKTYIESGKLQQLVPEKSAADEKALVVWNQNELEVVTQLGNINLYDSVLVGVGATGAVLLISSSALGLFMWSLPMMTFAAIEAERRDVLAPVAALSGGIVFAITHPAMAASAAYQFASTATTEAIKLSTTVVGTLVTVSGAIVGYLLYNNMSNGSRRKSRTRNKASGTKKSRTRRDAFGGKRYVPY